MTPLERAKAIAHSFWATAAAGEDELTRIIHQGLLDGIHVEVMRKQTFEQEANQEYREKLLLRNECIRLSDAMAVLSAFIWERGGPLPTAVLAAMDTYFPAEIARVFPPRDNGAPTPGADQGGSLLGTNAIEQLLPLPLPLSVDPRQGADTEGQQ